MANLRELFFAPFSKAFLGAGDYAIFLAAGLLGKRNQLSLFKDASFAPRLRQ
jgi:hypothetical protein